MNPTPTKLLAINCEESPMVFNSVTGEYECLPVKNGVGINVEPTPINTNSMMVAVKPDNSKKGNARNNPRHNKSFVGLDLGVAGDNEQLTLGANFGKERGAYLYGLQISYGLNGDEVPRDLLEYPVPHVDCQELGWQNDGGEYGFLVFGGLEFVQDMFVVGGLGQTYQNQAFVAQSNVTSWYYTQRTKIESSGDYYLGFHLRLAQKPSYMSLGYQARRGIVIGFNYSR